MDDNQRAIFDAAQGLVRENHDVAAATAKATPPAVVSMLSVSGVSLNDIVLVATLIYVTLQIIFLIHDKFKKRRFRKTQE